VSGDDASLLETTFATPAGVTTLPHRVAPPVWTPAEGNLGGRWIATL